MGTIAANKAFPRQSFFFGDAKLCAFPSSHTKIMFSLYSFSFRLSVSCRFIHFITSFYPWQFLKYRFIGQGYAQTEYLRVRPQYSILYLFCALFGSIRSTVVSLQAFSIQLWSSSVSEPQSTHLGRPIRFFISSSVNTIFTSMAVFSISVHQARSCALP